MSGQLSLPLLAALAAVCLWILCDEGQVEARRNVQKYERDYPTKFWASGLRTIREPLGERSNLDRARAVVGLRAAISAMLEEIENREMNSTSGSSSNDQEGQPVYSSKRSGQRSFGGASRLNYLISPISNQILLNDERDLANSVGDSLSEKYNTVWRSLHQGRAEDSIECRTIRSSIELSRDDVDKTSGQLVRNCKGAVALNRCEGSCSSSVLPSIKSRNGFKKECRCCNESSFRRIQVRLRECYSTLDNRRIGFGTGGVDGTKDDPNSYMDIEVEEPIDCRCRSCEAYVR